MFIFNTGKMISKFFTDKEKAKRYLATHKHAPGCVEYFITELPKIEIP